ncbi:MAG: class I SAM-dependent methyltransferase [Acidimicrobiales bacterium]
MNDTQPAPWPWDLRYAENEWPNEPDSLLVELAGGLTPGTALDLGCGPGRNAIWLATQGWHVTGVDASAVGLDQARQRAKSAGVSLDLVQGDLLSYEPPMSYFDLVVIANIHLLSPEREHFFATASSAIAPGGHLFLVGHHLDSLGKAGPPDPARLYTEELLQGAFPSLTVEPLMRHERPRGDDGDPLIDVVLWATRPSGTQP